MKRITTYSLATLGVVLIGLSARAQVTVTTSTNAVPTPVSSPMIQPDTLRPNKPGMAMPQGDDRETRQNRRERRKNRSKTNQPATNSNDYRQNVGNGTASNNSNTTNYNSQNAVAPASGVNAVTAPASGNGSMSTNTSGDGTAKGSVAVGTTMGATTASGSSAVSGAATPGAVANPDRTRSKTLSVGDFIAASPNHTTLQNALQTSTLDKKLQEGGPFTVFAPSNEAFKTLPTQTQRVLLEGQNLDALKSLLANHVVTGEVDTAELMRRIKAGNGKTTLQTLAGKPLTVEAGANGQLNITDQQGVTALITLPDHYETNGVVHGITGVLTSGGTVPFR